MLRDYRNALTTCTRDTSLLAQLRYLFSNEHRIIILLCIIIDPLSSYPTLEQLSQLECDQWLQLGVRLGLDNDQLETIKKSQHPTAATLRAAKVKNIDMQWKDIVEALVSIGEYNLAENVCTQQGQQI